jgi:hypothetical protein
MTRSLAFKILGITAGTDKKDLKKKYRQLMHQVHPDTEAFDTASYAFSAQEINEAYAFLRQNEDLLSAPEKDRQKTGQTGKKQMKWNAPSHEHAYTTRTIYQYAEDADGEILGSFAVATGKYLWIAEEDFPLFLKSMSECSKRLLDEVDAQMNRDNLSAQRIRFQAELSYLLAQQFIDATATLKRLLTPEELSDATIYSIPSMLELAADAPPLRSGMVLYPARIHKHKLFLTTKSGKNAGYVSFRDDRLYYIIIPLFEQKRAQVKISISARQDAKMHRSSGSYKNLDFLVRLPHDSAGAFPENINLQIDALLSHYKTCPSDTSF